MATLQVTKNYNDDNALTEDMLDDAFDSIEAFLNTTKINEDNIQDSGVTADKIASSAVTAAKLASSAVETAKINDLAVTTGKINDLAVTTAKIAANAVTRAKLESLGQQVSSSSGTFTTTSSTFSQITNLSVSLTTTGRPVYLAVVSADTSENMASAFGGIMVPNGNSSKISFRRDSSCIAITPISNGSERSNFIHVDTPSAGTYTYSVYAAINGGSTFTARDVKLIAFEL